MTQVKTCLCVPFLFGFPSFTIFLVKNKASASFSFGKWPAFFVGINFCKWDNANPIKSGNLFWVQQFLPLSPIVKLQWLPSIKKTTQNPNSDFDCLPTFLLKFFQFTCPHFRPYRTFEPKRSCVYAGQTGFAGFLVSLVQNTHKEKQSVRQLQEPLIMSSES